MKQFILRNLDTGGEYTLGYFDPNQSKADGGDHALTDLTEPDGHGWNVHDFSGWYLVDLVENLGWANTHVGEMPRMEILTR